MIWNFWSKRTLTFKLTINCAEWDEFHFISPPFKFNQCHSLSLQTVHSLICLRAISDKQIKFFRDNFTWQQLWRLSLKFIAESSELSRFQSQTDQWVTGKRCGWSNAELKIMKVVIGSLLRSCAILQTVKITHAHHTTHTHSQPSCVSQTRFCCIILTGIRNEIRTLQIQPSLLDQIKLICNYTC